MFFFRLSSRRVQEPPPVRYLFRALMIRNYRLTVRDRWGSIRAAWDERGKNKNLDPLWKDIILLTFYSSLSFLSSSLSLIPLPLVLCKLPLLLYEVIKISSFCYFQDCFSQRTSSCHIFQAKLLLCFEWFAENNSIFTYCLFRKHSTKANCIHL